MVAPRTNLRLTHARLLEAVRYDPETGHFWRLGLRGSAPKDKPLGHVEKNGYRRITIDQETHQANRLAWFYMTGEWPKLTVDHIDLDRDNNAWANLRAATHSQQHANTPGRLSIKGAHWNRFRGYWQSQIIVQGKCYWLGRYETPEEAHEAYVSAAKRFHGEFARAK